MDSGINKAVSNHHYGVKLLRLSLAVHLIQLLDENDRRQFWAVYETADVEGFREILSRIREKLKHIRSQGIYHERTEQLLTDAIDWGLCYPEPLLEGTRSELDSPNIVAFTLLVDMLHDLHQRTGGRVGTFIHDEQNQFAKYLKKSYELLRGNTIHEHRIVPLLPEVKKLRTFSCDLQIAKSSHCIGLQLIDVALWLIKRLVDRDGAIEGDCGDLAQSVIRNGFISQFTLEAMQMEVASMWEELQSTEPTEHQIKKAAEILDELERRRIGRISEPPD